MGSWGGGVGWRVGGGVSRRVWGGGLAVGGGGSQGGGAYARPTTLQPHAYLQEGCVSGAGLGKLPVDVVKQGLQMGCPQWLW